jgi:hypothetical protein
VPGYLCGMGQLGRYLVLLAIVLGALGLVLMLGDRLGLGKLPGDIVLRRKNTTFYFPIVTSILVSVVLTLLLNLFLRRK